MTGTLPLDICRCHDDKCSSRDSCLRYADRASGRVHADSVWPSRGDHDPCQYRIELDAYSKLTPSQSPPAPRAVGQPRRTLPRWMLRDDPEPPGPHLGQTPT